MKTVKEKMWAMVTPREEILISTLTWTRKDCVASFLDGGNIDWGCAKVLGYTCVKVFVTIETL